MALMDFLVERIYIYIQGIQNWNNPTQSNSDSKENGIKIYTNTVKEVLRREFAEFEESVTLYTRSIIEDVGK